LQPKTYTKRSNGKPRKTPCGSYRCPNYTLGYHQPDCIKTIGVKKCDEELWRKVWGLIAEPGRFENLLQARIDQLQGEEVDAGAECERLERELDNLAMERQKVITWARKMFITEDDLQTQIAGLALQENILQKELDSKRLLVGNRIDRFLELSKVYRKQVKAGMEAINETPSNKDQAKRQFKFRRKIIDAIVNRVDVTPDKDVKVHFDFNLTELAEIKSTTS